MKLLVIELVKRVAVLRDIHEEITPVREPVVHFLDGVDDEIDRRVERLVDRQFAVEPVLDLQPRSEEHTSELQSLMRISYAVFCLNKKTKHRHTKHNAHNT